ncbi:MAG: TolC family protein [Dysgonamonadaceae bacterium]|jgi:outer membrane protein|nr:TolC family protein [Dysgonamonadaceae bacterium]
MKTKYVFLLITALVFLTGHTVQSQTNRWSLEDCIRYAIEHNLTIKRMEIQQSSAEVTLNTSEMSRFPDLNAKMEQNWGFGRTPTATGLYENTNQSNASFSIGSSIPLFTGFRIPNEIARDKLELQAAVENLNKAKEDLSLNIASLFLQALFNKELLKINEEQMDLSKMQVDRTSLLVDAGKVPASQLYDIRAQVANDKVNVVQSDNNLKISLLDLAQSLELEQNTGFDILTPELNDVITENIGSLKPIDVIFGSAVQTKPVIKTQELSVESAEKTLKIAQSGYMPTLNLTFGYGTNYYYTYGDNEHPNETLSYQLKNKGQEYIGLSLNIPIFNRFSVRNQVRQAQFNIETQRLTLENAKKDLYKEIQTAYLNATSAREKYRAAVEAVKSTSESFKYAQERYEAGKSTVYEFNEAKTKLARSLSEEAQAKYDYIFRSKILDFYYGIPIKL